MKSMPYMQNWRQTPATPVIVYEGQRIYLAAARLYNDYVRVRRPVGKYAYGNRYQRRRMLWFRNRSCRIWNGYQGSIPLELWKLCDCGPWRRIYNTVRALLAASGQCGAECSTGTENRVGGLYRPVNRSASAF